jgi:hypothetical protein
VSDAAVPARAEGCASGEVRAGDAGFMTAGLASWAREPAFDGQVLMVHEGRSEALAAFYDALHGGDQVWATYRSVQADGPGFVLPVTAARRGAEERCGDSYVSYVQTTVAVGFAVRLEFAEKADADAFAAGYEGGSDFVTMPQALVSGRARIHVAAYQAGGAEGQLEAILGQSQCTNANLVACDQTFKALEAYRVAMIDQAYTDKAAVTLDDLHGWALLDYGTSPYATEP